LFNGDRAAVSAQRLVTLTGVGGVGNTRLAVDVAAPEVCGPSLAGWARRMDIEAVDPRAARRWCEYEPGLCANSVIGHYGSLLTADPSPSHHREAEWMFCARGPVSQAFNRAAREQAAHTRRPRLTPQDLATLLGRAGARGFAEEILRLMSAPIDNGT
jgi:hypothetical protein